MSDTGLATSGRHTVSVIMPTFNSEAVVRRAIDSVMAQTHGSWEVIVVDDASKDDTVAVVEAAGLPRGALRIVRLSENVGPGPARNEGLKVASGEWIALLDADDAWLPYRLERLLEVADGGAADFIADNVEGFDAGTLERTGRYIPPFRSTRLTLGDHLKGELAGGRIDGGFLKPIFRSAFIREMKLAYRNVRHGEDYLFYLEALCLGAIFSLVKEGMYLYTTPVGKNSRRISAESATVTDGKRLAGELRGVADSYAERLSDGERSLFKGKIRELENSDEWWAFERAVQERDIAKAFAYVTKPQVIPRLLRRIRYQISDQFFPN